VHKINSRLQTRRSLPTSGMDEQHNRHRFWKTSLARWAWEVGWRVSNENLERSQTLKDSAQGVTDPLTSTPVLWCEICGCLKEM
jgi:hypothetical protein